MMMMMMKIILSLALLFIEGSDGLPTVGDFAVLTVARLMWRKSRSFCSDTIAPDYVVVVMLSSMHNRC